MKKNIFTIFFLAGCLLPYTSKAANPDILMDTGPQAHYSTEKVMMLVTVNGMNSTNYPVDIYLEGEGKEVMVNFDVNLGSNLSSYTRFVELDLKNFPFSKSEEAWFNIFVCKSGTPCAYKDKTLRKNIISESNIHILPAPDKKIVDVQINGSDNPKPVKYGDKIKVTWKSNATAYCNALSGSMPDTNGEIWPYFSNELNDYYKHLETSGSMTLIAKPGAIGTDQTTWIGVQCRDSASESGPHDYVYLKISDFNKAYQKAVTSSQPRIEILSPNQDVTWEYDKKQTIKWKSSNVKEKVKVHLYSQERHELCEVGTYNKNKKSAKFTPKTTSKCEFGTLYPGTYVLAFYTGNYQTAVGLITIPPKQVR